MNKGHCLGLALANCQQLTIPITGTENRNLYNTGSTAIEHLHYEPVLVRLFLMPERANKRKE